MHSLKKPFLVGFIFLISLCHILAQTQKGLWTAGGVFNFDQIASQGDFTSNILIAPELGYAFTDRWMVQGKISISIIDRLSIVGHGLNLRYAFTKRERLEGYAGLEYNRSERRFLVNGNNGKRTILEISPFTGYLYFLKKNIALDVALYYPVYRKSKAGGSTNDNSSNMSLRFGLNFYFDSNLSKDTVHQNPGLSKGQWMIGGGMTIGSSSANLIALGTNDRFINELAPYFARMMTRRWMLGTGFYYANTSDLQEFYFGLSPFVRYYLIQNNKRMIYAETGTDFQFRYLRKNLQNQGVSPTVRAGSLGIGMSRWILPGIALDFFLGGEWKEAKLRFDNNFIFQQRVKLRIGLEAYF